MGARHLELPHDGNGQCKDDEIGEDVAGGVGVPRRQRGNADGANVLLPEALDRAAVEDGDEEEDQAPGGNQRRHGNHQLARLDGHQGEVLQQQSQLDEAQADVVKDD